MEYIDIVNPTLNNTFGISLWNFLHIIYYNVLLAQHDEMSDNHNINGLAFHIQVDITATYNKLCLLLCGCFPISLHILYMISYIRLPLKL